MAATAAARQSADAIAEVDRRIDNLVNALAEGAPSGPIRSKLASFEAQRAALKQTRAQGDDPIPDLPADLGHDYREAIDHLVDELHDPDNPRALELARGLIEKIIINPPDDDGDPLIIDFEGDFAALLILAAGKKMSIRPDTQTYRLVSNLAGSAKGQPGAWIVAQGRDGPGGGWGSAPLLASVGQKFSGLS